MHLDHISNQLNTFNRQQLEIDINTQKHCVQVHNKCKIPSCMNKWTVNICKRNNSLEAYLLMLHAFKIYLQLICSANYMHQTSE